MEIHNYRFQFSATLNVAKKMMPEDQYNYMLRFIHRLRAQDGMSEGRITKYVLVLRRLSKYTDIRRPSEEGVFSFLYDMEAKGFSEESIATYRRVLKAYLKRIGYEELAKKIKVKRPGSRLKKSDMLSHDEIYRMIKFATPLYQAIVILAYESGARPSEFLMLKVRDIQFTDNYGYLSIPMGKTVSRTIPIMLSIPYLRKWIYDYHPDPKPENPLWYSRSGRPLSYVSLKRNINKLMHKAGVKTKYKFFYIFRHTRATDLALYLTEEAMRKYFGWAPGSKMPSRYVHIAMQDVENKILEMYGVKKKKKPLYSRCLRCGAVNLSGVNYCIVCGGPVTTESMAAEVKKSFEVQSVLERLKRLEEMYEKLMKQGQE